MFENTNFNVVLDYVENEDLILTNHLKEFTIEALDIEDAVIQLDKYLFEVHLTNSTNDFTEDYNNEATTCRVSFSDDEKGLQISYVINTI